jgi:hypothetical protein
MSNADQSNNEILEYGNNGKCHIAMPAIFKPIIPIFHPFNIPA